MSTDRPTHPAVPELAQARYVSLETFKQNGDPVRTPVWIVRLGDELAVWTDASSFKIKRLRRNPRFKVARCNASGRTILGPWYEGTARLVEDEAGIARVKDELRAKYGWQVRTIEFVNRFRRAQTGRHAGIVLRLGQPLAG